MNQPKLSINEQCVLGGGLKATRLFAIGYVGQACRALTELGLMRRNDDEGREAYSITPLGIDVANELFPVRK